MILTAALLLASSASHLTSDQSKVVKKLENELMAPCCYSQTIAVHMSYEAAQMRDEVTQMVAQGLGEKEIVDHYRTKYGETILVVPDGKVGQILSLTPWIVFLLSPGLIVYLIRRWKDRAVFQPSTPAPREPLGPTWSAIRDRIRYDVENSI